MNLNDFHNFLKSNGHKYTKTKINYAFIGKITLHHKEFNGDHSVTPRLSPIQYKMFSKLVERYL